MTFAKVNNVCNRLSCLYKRGCVLWVQNALLISTHFGGHACSFVCKRESGMSSFSEASWAILMGVNGVDCRVGLAVGAVGFMPAGISSCHLLNRLPTNRGSLFGSTCHTVQSNPCQTERLWGWGSGSARHRCWWDAADWMNFLVLGVWSAIYATPTGFNNKVFFFFFFWLCSNFH